VNNNNIILELFRRRVRPNQTTFSVGFLIKIRLAPNRVKKWAKERSQMRAISTAWFYLPQMTS
jgi:hypothetical protein